MIDSIIAHPVFTLFTILIVVAIIGRIITVYDLHKKRERVCPNCGKGFKITQHKPYCSYTCKIMYIKRVKMLSRELRITKYDKDGNTR